MENLASFTDDGGTVRIGAFLLDRSRGSLLRGNQSVSLRPKTWEVLNYLADRPGVLVSPDTLYDAVWHGVAITPKTLTNVIAELRRALEDDSGEPRYIETVHRRGYRFIATPQPAGTAGAPVTPPAIESRPSVPRPASAAIFVGRAGEIETLTRCWQSALAGRGQLVFLAGEPGIGKTTVLNAFLSELAGEQPSSWWIARGQCIERHGAHEAYMPVLDGLEKLAAGADGKAVADLLSQYAPSWLAQMPWLVAPAQRDTLTSSLQSASAARMLREGARFVAALTEQRPLVMVIEDLHWSDPETLDLISAVGQRLQDARLMLICTYRPTEARVNGHPMVSVATGLLRNGATQILLEPFTRADVSDYLESRFPGGAFTRRVIALVEEHSGGNPLLVRAVCDHMLAKGWVRAKGPGWQVSDDVEALGRRLPDTVRDIIEAQLALLDTASLEALEVASVVGVEFSAPAVAAGLATSAERAEAVLNKLRGVWLVGRDPLSVSASAPPISAYAFAHSLYQRVFYNRIPEHRRQRLHQNVGEYLEESGYEPHHPALLAAHFECSGDHARAVYHLEEAARAVGRRAASRDVTAYLQRALAQLRQLPEDAHRAIRELRLQVSLGEAATQAFGPDDVRVVDAVARVRELCPLVDDPETLFPALHGLWLYTLLKGDSRATRELVHQTMALAESNRTPEIELLGELMCGTATCFEGWPSLAAEHLNKAAAALARLKRLPPTGIDVAVELRCNLAWSNWLCGYPDRARRIAGDALRVAQESGNPNSQAVALIYHFNVHHLCGDWLVAHETARALQVLGEQRDFILSQRTGMILEAAVLMETGALDGAMAALQQSGATHESAGLQQIVRTFFLGRVALACGRIGLASQGLLLANEAMSRIAASGLASSEAEILRIQGELIRQLDRDTLASFGLLHEPQATAESLADACFERALMTARKQGSKAWELRAAVSRARLSLAQGRRETAREQLQSVYAWFEEGFDTADLRDAGALMALLTGEPAPS